MRALILAAVLWIGATSAWAECRTFDDIATDVFERFPESYLHDGPLVGEDATFYVFASPHAVTLLVFAFVDGCFDGFFEISNAKLYGRIS